MYSRSKNALKYLLSEKALRALRYLFNARYRYHRHVENLRGVAQSTLPRVWEAVGGKVHSGPFRGLNYIPQSVCSSLGPKVLGTYEMELVNDLEDLISAKPQTVVIIGAAEGYYACGLATRLPKANVLTFETDSAGRELLSELCAKNQLSHRVAIHGHCGHADLRNILSNASNGRTAIICDIEGGEISLLDPEQHPELHHCYIIVEIHPWAADRPSDVIATRFSNSRIRRIFSERRQPCDFPQLGAHNFSSTQKLACLDEFRPPQMGWLSIAPNSW